MKGLYYIYLGSKVIVKELYDCRQVSDNLFLFSGYTNCGYCFGSEVVFKENGTPLSEEDYGLWLNPVKEVLKERGDIEGFVKKLNDVVVDVKEIKANGNKRSIVFETDKKKVKVFGSIHVFNENDLFIYLNLFGRFRLFKDSEYKNTIKYRTDSGIVGINNISKIVVSDLG